MQEYAWPYYKTKSIQLFVWRFVKLHLRRCGHQHLRDSQGSFTNLLFVAGMVSTYSSMSFCTVKKSCANAKNGWGSFSFTPKADRGVSFWLECRFAQATEMATAALQGTPNTQCLDAITTALCAYHFPRCEDDEKRFPAVCYDTCQNLELQCKLQLDDIVLIQEWTPSASEKFVSASISFVIFSKQGRCQGPPTEDNKATQDKCTAAAPHMGLGFLIALLPFFFVSVFS